MEADKKTSDGEEEAELDVEGGGEVDAEATSENLNRNVSSPGEDKQKGEVTVPKESCGFTEVPLNWSEDSQRKGALKESFELERAGNFQLNRETFDADFLGLKEASAVSSLSGSEMQPVKNNSVFEAAENDENICIEFKNSNTISASGNGHLIGAEGNCIAHENLLEVISKEQAVLLNKSNQLRNTICVSEKCFSYNLFTEHGDSPSISKETHFIEKTERSPFPINNSLQTQNIDISDVGVSSCDNEPEFKVLIQLKGDTLALEKQNAVNVSDVEDDLKNDKDDESATIGNRLTSDVKQCIRKQELCKEFEKQEQKNTDVELQMSKILNQLTLDIDKSECLVDSYNNDALKVSEPLKSLVNINSKCVEVNTLEQATSVTYARETPLSGDSSEEKEGTKHKKPIARKGECYLEKEKKTKGTGSKSVDSSVLLNVHSQTVVDSVKEQTKIVNKISSKETKDRKRPGRKQIIAMQEAIKKMQEEQEKHRLETEANQVKDEEEERLRKEKLILEQAKKDRKKQKDKEKKKRLKAEGKVLSKSQKFSLARMEATLAAFRKLGVEVPNIGEKRLTASKHTVNGSKTRNSVSSSTDECISLDGSDGFSSGNCKNKDLKFVFEQQSREHLSSLNSNSSSEGGSYTHLSDVIKESRSYSCSELDNEKKILSRKFIRQSSSESESGDKITKSLQKISTCGIENEKSDISKSTPKLRAPVICVLGHVDTGKTKILDKIRKTHVQDSEAGGITQQIGATMVPSECLKEKCKMVKCFAEFDIKIPGLLIIDTPGHEAFSNMRIRGSSLCDITVLVVDIMHGLEPQTIESINLLKRRKIPFIVALNKIDRLYGWQSLDEDIESVIKKQKTNTFLEFNDHVKQIICEFAVQSLNVALFYENSDPRSFISIVPTSAITGDGIGNLLALIAQLTQNMMTKKLRFSEELQAFVLEVKAIAGLGTTIDVILVNGRLRESDIIVLAGQDGPIVTHIRSLLMPQPLKELRVKNPYQEFKEVQGAQGVKICAKDLEKVIAGLPLFIARSKDEVELLKSNVASLFGETINSIKLSERGVYVHASTLGSLEAFLSYLRASSIPYAGIKIGPVVKKDVMKACAMLEHSALYAVILAFDVKIEKDAQEMADYHGVKIFNGDIIYHLFDQYVAYRDLKLKNRDEIKHLAIFPCKLRIIPYYVSNKGNPFISGVTVEDGILKVGTPLCIPSHSFIDLGTVIKIEVDGKSLETARKGADVSVVIEPAQGATPQMYGEDFDDDDILVSKINKQSIEICKEYYSDDLQKSDWLLMAELKDLFLNM